MTFNDFAMLPKKQIDKRNNNKKTYSSLAGLVLIDVDSSHHAHALVVPIVIVIFVSSSLSVVSHVLTLLAFSDASFQIVR